MVSKKPSGNLKVGEKTNLKGALSPKQRALRPPLDAVTISHNNFLNAYLGSKGAATVDLGKVEACGQTAEIQQTV